MKSFGQAPLTPLALAVALLFGYVLPGQAEQAKRVVSAGGSVTEIIYALGEQHRLVARDVTSNHPKEALKLPDIGYVRRLSPEGLLSVNPDLIIVEDGAGPPEALDLIRETEIPVATIPMGFDRDAVLNKINAVAVALDVPEKGAALSAEVAASIDAATAVAKEDMSSKRVLFVLTLQGGRVLAGGSDTAAEGVITMAGGTNAVQDFDGYKLMTDEAIIAAAPEVILVMAGGRRGMDMSDDDLLAHAALGATPAAQSKSILRMDGMYLLGFSVRTGDAITELATGLRDAGS